MIKRDKEKSNNVMRKPANICRIDKTTTKVQVAHEFDRKPIEDLKTGKIYQLSRTGNGLQMT